MKEAKKDISKFDLKIWHGQNIVNKNTEDVAERILGDRKRKSLKLAAMNLMLLKRLLQLNQNFIY